MHVKSLSLLYVSVGKDYIHKKKKKKAVLNEDDP